RRRGHTTGRFLTQGLDLLAGWLGRVRGRPSCGRWNGNGRPLGNPGGHPKSTQQSRTKSTRGKYTPPAPLVLVSFPQGDERAEKRSARANHPSDDGRHGARVKTQ